MQDVRASQTRYAALVLGGTLLASCGDESGLTDPSGHTGYTPFFTTDPIVGLFHLDGRAVRRRARVWVSQSGVQTELTVSNDLAADLLAGGHQAEYIAVPPDRAGNVYVFHPRRVIVLASCGPALHYRVEAEGCDAVEGDWSWNDNTYPERLDVSFHTPVRLTCRPYQGEDDPVPSDGGVAVTLRRSIHLDWNTGAIIPCISHHTDLSAGALWNADTETDGWKYFILASRCSGTPAAIKASVRTNGNPSSCVRETGCPLPTRTRLGETITAANDRRIIRVESDLDLVSRNVWLRLSGVIEHVNSRLIDFRCFDAGITRSDPLGT